MTKVQGEGPRHPCRIVVVGELSCDTIIMLNRQTTFGDHNAGTACISPGGTAAIVAHNVAVLGGVADFCGHIGSGSDDCAAAGALAEVGVRIVSSITTQVGRRVVIVVDPSGERTMFAFGDTPHWSALELPVGRGDLVFFEGWHLLSSLTDADFTRLVFQASAAGSVVVIDVCTANGASTAHHQLLADLPLDVVLANESEADALNLLTAPPAQTVVVHCGSRPTRVLHDGVLSEHTVNAVVPIDTTGAGDTFAAGFLHALSRNADIANAVRGGHAAAREVVQVVGPLLPDRARAPHPARSQRVAVWPERTRP